MTKNFSNIIHVYLSIIIFLTLFLSIFFIPFYSNNNTISDSVFENNFSKLITSSSELCWPLPGYTRISSPFGYRSSPTAGATNFHGGIDLPAPVGTNIVSAISGKVTKTGFMGSGGCSVMVENEQYTVIFHHIAPAYMVHSGDYVYKGQVIAQVGPKNVFGFENNPYKDSNR